jgi:hypothetical protein
MRVFNSLFKVRTLLPTDRIVDAVPMLSAEGRATLNYNQMALAALVRERRGIELL